MDRYEYLRNLREDIPEWLNDFNEQTPFSRVDFFKSRVAYHPGSGTDGHPVMLFGASHSAHCFVYADYGVTQPELEKQLADKHHGFRGNFDRFGRDGLLSSIVSQCNIFPTFLLVERNTAPWEGCSRIENVEPDVGGMHNTQGSLYKLDDCK